MVDFKFEHGKKEAPGAEAQGARGAEAQSVVKEIEEIIAQAAARGATQMHFDPRQSDLQIRLRIEDRLEEIKTIPDNLKSNVINRIKVLSGMDITRTQRVQRGYFKLELEGRKIEMYSYSFPSVYGEKVIVKISSRGQVSLSLDTLGMIPQMLESYKTTLHRGSGLILVTGPPGNGKRTTIYASMANLAKPEMLVMSYETVIKYELPGMIQGKPDDRGETSFAEGVRGMLEQEPDLAMIGEVQELDVARYAIQASFAKRYVFGRVNANDTVNAMYTFIDLGVPPFLVASSITGVVAQRLLRKLCDACKEKYEPSAALVQEIGFKLAPGTVFFRPKGCDKCKQSGYVGTLAMFEYYQAREELSEMIVGKQSARDVRQRALQLGMAPMKRDGIQKALTGWTSVEEVLNKL